MQINTNGHLVFAGVDVTTLAAKYGDPLYIMDEEMLRSNIKTYIKASEKYLPKKSRVLYASKALCIKSIYNILESEGAGADVVSPGEIYTAISAGFNPSNLFFHGNNKTDWDINFAIENKVGFFVVDNYNELESLCRIAKDKNMVQKILLRVTLGIDPHTQEKINTGKIDSQFGVPVDTGQALEFAKRAMSMSNIELLGFHCHIGSQIFEIDAYIDEIDKMCEFACSVKKETGFTAKYFNIGGGFAVKYIESQNSIDITKCIKKIGERLTKNCNYYNYDIPSIILEPGRSIVANAGITIYKATGVKEIDGYLNYVTVDGGMTDNIRHTLYNSEYTVLNASRANSEKDYLCTIAGRCCESGDRIAENVLLTKPNRGEYIAVLVTGAYNYSMASNYNKVPRPGVVMISDKKPRLVVRSQTFDDMINCEL